MTAIIEKSITPPVSRKHFTREEYHFLADSGLLNDGHYELLGGDIFTEMPQKEPHGSLVMVFVFLMAQIFGQEFVRCQMPVILSDDSEPEPDIVVTTQPRSVYQTGVTPNAKDVRLLIEVAVSTLSYDSGEKAIRYARSGISDYWILDAENRRLLVHRQPSAQGYQSVVALTANDSVSPIASSQSNITVKDLLP